METKAVNFSPCAKAHLLSPNFLTVFEPCKSLVSFASIKDHLVLLGVVRRLTECRGRGVSHYANGVGIDPNPSNAKIPRSQERREAAPLLLCKGDEGLHSKRKARSFASKSGKAIRHPECSPKLISGLGILRAVSDITYGQDGSNLFLPQRTVVALSHR